MTLTVQQESILGIPAAVVSSTALTLPDDAPLSLEAALGLVRQCETVQDASHYWRGDMYLWTERRFGRDALQEAISEKEYDALRPYIWVSERVPPSRRDPRLTWSHCRLVGSLEPAQQTKWLTQAADAGWSVRELREAMKPPKQRRKLDRDGVLLLSHDRIGMVWTEEDDMAVRAALGMDA